MSDQTIMSVSREGRVFKPSPEFRSQANIGSFAAYRRLHSDSVNAPEKFWSTQAKRFLFWRKIFTRVLDWKLPHARWFTGGRLNISENCLDRHLGTPREHKANVDRALPRCPSVEHVVVLRRTGQPDAGCLMPTPSRSCFSRDFNVTRHAGSNRDDSTFHFLIPS